MAVMPPAQGYAEQARLALDRAICFFLVTRIGGLIVLAEIKAELVLAQNSIAGALEALGENNNA